MLDTKFCSDSSPHPAHESWGADEWGLARLGWCPGAWAFRTMQDVEAFLTTSR